MRLWRYALGGLSFLAGIAMILAAAYFGGTATSDGTEPYHVPAYALALAGIGFICLGAWLCGMRTDTPDRD